MILIGCVPSFDGNEVNRAVGGGLMWSDNARVNVGGTGGPEADVNGLSGGYFES